MGRVLENFVKASKEIPMIGVVVYQDGLVRDRFTWEPEYRMNQYSVSKSFVATGVGIAIAEGLVDINQPIKTYLKDHWPLAGSISEESMDRLGRVTLYHLLTMSLGQGKANLMAGQRLLLKTDNWVTYILSQPLLDEPGTKFLYNNAAVYLASVILEQVTGMSLVDYLQPRLFDPLGIYRPTWETDRQGHAFGASGLSLSVSEIARYGQLHLQKGQWEGQEILSKHWVDLASQVHINSNPSVPGSSDYGLCFWRGPHQSYRADGKYGQLSIVLPDKNAVVAVNAFNRSTTSLIDLVWKDLYPYL